MNIDTGARLRTKRLAMGWSQTKLAELCGISLSTMQRLEAKKELPRKARLLLEAVFENANLR